MPAISITELAYQLYQRQLIKFGKFTLHSGLISPIYFDLRNLIVDPTFFSQVIDLYVEALSGLENTFDFIAGPAYTGIPIATLLSQRLNKPMILIRKDAKTHGTGGGSQIVGSVLDPEALNRVLIVDDVITSGASLLETIDILEKAEYRPVECLVLIDRRPVTQRMRTLSNGTFINSVFSVESVLREIINLPGFPSDLKLQILAQSEWFPTFSQKINCVLHPQVRKLLHIIEHKKTRLVLSADSSNPAEILNLIDKLGPEIAVLKIHSDILEFDRDYTETWFYINLKQLASQFQFLILEDRKLADIGSTTALQLKKISKWADLVTAHIISGPGVIQAVRENCNGFGLGLLLIAEMSSSSNLITSDYTKMAVRMAQENPDIVAGLICQSRLLDARFLHFTPGVKLSSPTSVSVGVGDGLGQQYRPPETIDTDLFIVGRGILEAPDPLIKAREYRLSLNY